MKNVILFLISLMCIDAKGQVNNHSYGKPQEASYNHLDWNAKVDFDRQVISAEAIYQLKVTAQAQHLILDVRHLQIEAVLVDDQTAIWQVGKLDPILGAPLTISITPKSKKVKVVYSTTESSDALLWVEGKNPFLFTQSQAILARTWIPCQDQPALRFTYSAKVEVPAHLLALMSARNPQKIQEGKSGKTRVYSFEQPKPIPSYLMALAVGDIAFKPISDRAGVYATPDILPSAAKELEDLEKMIQAAEKLYGPYQWERYDVLILPAAFPFGGMENPMLTFATPTILAGDKSLVSLIAHELAHSWSGNLVTNETWNDFWLNEGFTVYFEFRIMEELYGYEVSEMLAALAVQDLYSTIEELHPDDTRLKLKLDERDPDDGMNDIAYNKGYWFLRTIEERVGREKFDRFLKNYFTQHAFKVMNTEQFIEIIRTQLLDPGNYRYIGADQWIYEAGVPKNAYPIVSERIEKVDQWVEAYQLDVGMMKNMPWKEWMYQEQYRFLTKVKFKSLEDLKAFDVQWKVSSTGNKEILFAWILQTIEMGDRSKESTQVLTQFLSTVGRRKFISPLYKSLKVHGRQPEAVKYMEQYEKTYHAVTRQTVWGFLKEK
jgi:leukotriene-A4 hydrolase